MGFSELARGSASPTNVYVNEPARARKFKPDGIRLSYDMHMRHVIAEDNKNQHNSQYPISVKFHSALGNMHSYIAGIR